MLRLYSNALGPVEEVAESQMKQEDVYEVRRWSWPCKIVKRGACGLFQVTLRTRGLEKRRKSFGRVGSPAENENHSV
jgi:hypothetical protein